MIISDIFNKYGLNITGIVHVGAHQGNQLEFYVDYGIRNILFFEPVENNFYQLNKKIGRIKPSANIQCHKVALGALEHQAVMYVETDNNGMSCSILEPKEHLSQYPWIRFNKRECVAVKTMDSYQINTDIFNMLVVDVQGYELDVMVGACHTLSGYDYIIAEVNRRELYRDCTDVGALHSYITGYGFRLIECDWSNDSWGDALYVKTNLLMYYQ